MQSDKSTNWAFFLRVLGKAALLFVLFNLLLALFLPLETLGALTLYNWLLPGRERLPYGENPAVAYNLSLFNVTAMFASQKAAQPKTEDEFRVFVMGDSAAWGWFLENEDTLAGRLNAQEMTTNNGQRVVAYNLGYPVMSLTKDLMLLQEALQYEPDLIVWPVTLESFPRDKQLFAPLVQQNPQRIRPLITNYNLDLDPEDPRFVEPTFAQRTLAGQRRNLADLLRLQFYGFSWAATGIDQAIPDEIPLRKSDFEADESWQAFAEPTALTSDDLAFDVLEAGVRMAGETPVLIVNEAMFISSGANNDLRYNSFYPRWAYDQYRGLLAETAVANAWLYLDLWNSIAPHEFTDTPVHLTPDGSEQMAEMISPALLEIANSN